MSNAEAMLKPGQSKRVLKQSESDTDVEVDTEVTNNNNHFAPVLDTEQHYVGADRLAARIAATQVEQLDQLALIGYPTSFDEVTRDVVETALRLAARKVLES